MPIKSIDWKPIHAAFVSGVRAADLAEQYGVKLDTINRTATRKGWTKEKELIGQGIVARVSKSVIKSLKTRSEDWSETIIEDIEEQTAKLTLARKNPSILPLLLEHEGVAEKITNRGRKMFGLDQQERPTISLGIAINLPAPTVGSTVGMDGVIEVESNAQDQLDEPITPLDSEDV